MEPAPPSEGRVRLRPPGEQDRAAFVSALRLSKDLHDIWLEPADPHAWFDRLLTSCASETDRSLLVVRIADGSPVGVYNLSQIVHGPLCSAYVGYYALAPHAGKGYMREGLQLLLDHAFGVLALHLIEANIQPGNAASLRLVRVAGFRREGFSPRYLRIRGAWRDHERWAITAEDPRGRPPRATPES